MVESILESNLLKFYHGWKKQNKHINIVKIFF